MKLGEAALNLERLLPFETLKDTNIYIYIYMFHTYIKTTISLTIPLLMPLFNQILIIQF